MEEENPYKVRVVEDFVSGRSTFEEFRSGRPSSGLSSDEDSNNNNKDLGVWGNVPESHTLFLTHRMPVTRYYQALNAAEALVTEWSPPIATAVRRTADVLEKEAKTHILLWRSGSVIFPVLGKIAEGVLFCAGRNNEIDKQYRDDLVLATELHSL